MDQFRNVFFEECSDLLASAENHLSNLSSGDDYDPEDVHAVFRAVHSVKGGAGSFGFDMLVGFSHVFETTLDILRNDHVELAPQIIDLLLRANDVLTLLVQNAENNLLDVEPDSLVSVKEQLEGFVADARGNTDSFHPKEKIKNSPVSSVGHYTISFIPNLDLMRFGNEPYLILRELKRLSLDENFHVTAKIEKLPSLSTFNIENCYISWDISIATEASQERIKECFEFVEDDCSLTIQQENSSTKNSPNEKGEDSPCSPDNTEKSTAATIMQEESSPLQSSNLERQEAIEKNTATEKNTTTSTKNANQQTPPQQQSEQHVHSIRVELDRIDRLVNTVGEMVIKQAMLLDAAVFLKNKASEGTYDHFTKGLEELTQHTRELQESVMAIRAQPVKAVFARMPRLVRELATQLKKEIRIEMSGENTEIDKTVIERLGEPLTHMIRNAVDHGIESPELRIERGKPAHGTIRLNAEHKSGRIVIQIIDDGGGISRDAVLRKAKEREIIDDDENLSGEEIDQLIFHPGFSTASEITNISGRGVGMDVVKKSIQALGGRINIQSVEGQGCTFNMLLPLTLAVLDGMIVKAGNECYVIPLIHIIETLRPTSSQVHTIINGVDLLDLRQRNIPLIYLHDIFQISDATRDATNGIVVVMETEGGENIGLVVDEIVTQQQVVLKSLEANYDPIPGISAATILGNGQVSLILDVNMLSKI